MKIWGVQAKQTLPMREIVLQRDVPVIIIGSGLEADFKVTRECGGQDNQGRAFGNEHRVGQLVVLIVEAEGVVTRGGRHG